MSEALAVKTFILTIIIFVVLSATVFYEEPSCVTTNINPLGLLVPLLVSAVCAGMIMWISSEIWDVIKDRKKEK